MSAPYWETKSKTSAEAYRLTNLETIRILIVDDDPVFRRSLFKVLSGAGYSVFTAANATEALEFLSQIPFSLILMDMRKPHQGGIEALQTLISAAGKAKVIVISTFNESALQEKILKMGAKGFLVKPVRKAVILDAVSRTIKK